MTDDIITPPNWRDALSRFIYKRDVQGVARTVLERLRDSSQPSPLGVWAALEEPSEATGAVLGAFYLYAVGSAICDHRITPTEREHLKRLRVVLRIGEGQLLRHSRPAVEELVTREMFAILDDDQVDPREALYQVALQEALGLGYDEYSALTAAVVNQKLRPILEESQRGLLAEEFQRRLVALDSLVRVDRPASR